MKFKDKPVEYREAHRILHDGFWAVMYYFEKNLPVKPDPRPDYKEFYPIYMEYMESIPASATTMAEKKAALKRHYNTVCRRLRKVWAAPETKELTYESYRLAFKSLKNEA